MFPPDKNRITHEPDSAQNDEWISLAEAARAVPYSAEYLSLLARKKSLPAKKVNGVWYTTLPIVKEYMRRQMSRVLRPAAAGLRESPASVENLPHQNKFGTGQAGVRTGFAPPRRGGASQGPTSLEFPTETAKRDPSKIPFTTNVASANIRTYNPVPSSPSDEPLVPPEQVEKINESIFFENIISQVERSAQKAGEEEMPTDPKGRPEFRSVSSPLSSPPHAEEIKTLKGDTREFASAIVGGVEEELLKKEAERSDIPRALEEEDLLKIVKEQSGSLRPGEDAYSNILFQKFLTTFTAFLNKEVEARESILTRALHTVRGAYAAVLSHRKLFSLFLIFLLVFAVLPFRVVSAFFDSAYRSVAEVVNDANTVLGFRPGTSANEILLLDQEGKIAIFGNVETEGQFKSFAENGIAPIYVKSMTKVENLNADYLDNLSSEEFTLAFVTKNGNVTYDNVRLEGTVEVGQTLLVKGAANLLSSLSVDGELSVFGDTNLHGDTTLYKDLTVNGPARFKNVLSAQEIFANAGTFAESLLTHGNLTVNGQAVVRGFGIFQGGVSADTGTFRRGVSTGGPLQARGDVVLGGTDSDISLSSVLWSIDTEGNAIFSGDATIKDSLSVSATTSVNRLRASNIGIGTTTPGYEIGVVGSGLFEGLVIAYEGFVGNTLIATSTLSAEGLASFISGFISSASSTISSTLHVLDALVASSSLVVDGLSTLYGGFISSASSTIAAPLHVSDNLSASSTLTVGGLAAFDSGFISSASSSATTLSASDSLYASSSIAVDGNSFFALTGGSVGVASTSPAFLLSVDGAAYVSDTLFVGNAITATSTLTVGDLATFENGFISQASSTVSGPFHVSDSLSASSTLTLGGLGTFEGGGILGGASSTISGTLSLSNNVIANGGGIDIGDAGTRFGIMYADEMNASTLVGIITGGNSSSTTFTINSENGTADEDDIFLAFERGTITPNALLKWDSTNDNFVFNFGIIAQASSTIGGPFYVQDHLSASSTLTLGGLGTFDSGFISSASSTVSAPFHVSDVITSSSSIAVDGNSLFALTGGSVGIGTAGPLTGLQVGSITTTGGNLPDSTNRIFAVSTTAVSSDLNNAGHLMLADDSGIAANVGGAIAFGAQRAANTMAIIAGIRGLSENATSGQFDGYLQFSTRSGVGSNTERVRITSAGSVGIASTSPSALLSVDGTGYISGTLFVGDALTATSTLSVGNPSDSSVGLASFFGGFISSASSTVSAPFHVSDIIAGSSTLAIDQSAYFALTGGSVGIGTSTPQNLLHIYASEADAPLTFSATSTTGTETFDWTIGLDITDGSFKIASSTTLGTSDRFVIDGAGIGYFTQGLISQASSTVSGPFHVSDIITSSSSIAVDGTSLFALTGGSVGIASSTPWGQLSVEKLTTGAPTFAVSDNGSSTPWFVVNENGNVGIGTAGPGTKLDILGGLVSETDGSQRIRLRGYSAGLEIVDKDNAENFYIAIDDDDSNNLKIGAGYGPGQGLATYMTILSSGVAGAGNVGIASTSPSALLSVDGTGYISGTLFVGDALTATSTLSVGNPSDSSVGLASFYGGFISSASSTVSAQLTTLGLQVDGVLNASSTSLFSGDTLFLGNVSIGYTATTSQMGTTTQTHALQIEGGASMDGDIEVANSFYVKPRTASYAGVSFDTAGSGNTNPYGITQYGGFFWVVDIGNAEVYKYTTDGTYTGVSFDTAGSGNANPYGITQYGGFFWVSDDLDDEVYKYTTDGTYTGVSFDTAGSGNASPIGITQYGGFFWVVDSVDSDVYKYTTDGTYTGVSFDIAEPSANDSFFGITQYGGSFWVVEALDDEVYEYAIRTDAYVIREPTASSTPPASFGVGTSTPWGLFSVHASSTNIAIDPLFVVASTTPDGSNDTLFVINNLGNVGIASTTPWGQLSVEKVTTGAPTFAVSDYGSTTPWFVVNEDGNVGIGTVSPTEKLEVDGKLKLDETETIAMLKMGGAGRYSMGVDTAMTTITYHNLGSGIKFGSYDDTTFTEQMRINSSGNVGIGTTTPAKTLDVVGGTLLGGTFTDPGVAGGKKVGIGYNTTSNYGTIDAANWGVAASPLLLQSITSGLVGIGTVSPFSSARLTIPDGRIASVSDWDATFEGTKTVCINSGDPGADGHYIGACGASSLRFKENIKDSPLGLSEAMQLKPIQFTYINSTRDIRDPERIQFFFGAEDVAEIHPSLASYNNEGLPENVSQRGLIALLTRAIQEQQGEIEELGFKIYDLRNVIATSDAPTTTPSIYIDQNGQVGIGTTSPEYALHVAGDIAANSFINVSARDTKKDIKEISNSPNYSNPPNETDPVEVRLQQQEDLLKSDFNILEKIKNLPLFTYHYTYEADDAPLRMGLIAEESPVEVLSADKKGVDLYKLITFVTGGMKELIQSVERLALRVEDLSTRITRIENANYAAVENLKAGPYGELSTTTVENYGARSDLAPSASGGLEFSTAVLESFADFGMTVADGIAHFTTLVVNELLVQKLVVENMTANALTLGDAANRAGITMYDKNTGAPFCLSVINGNVATESGTCDAVENPDARTGLASQGPSLLGFSTATSTEEITTEATTTTSSFQFLESITNSDNVNYDANNANATTTEETASSAQIPDSSIQSATTTDETAVENSTASGTDEITKSYENSENTNDATTTAETAAVENSTASADLAPQGQTLLEFPTADEPTITTETQVVEEDTSAGEITPVEETATETVTETASVEEAAAISETTAETMPIEEPTPDAPTS